MYSAYISTHIGKGLAHSRNLALCVFASVIMLMAGYGLAKAEGARVFDSPQAAFEALIKAAQANDKGEIVSILARKPGRWSIPAMPRPTTPSGPNSSRPIRKSTVSFPTRKMTKPWPKAPRNGCSWK